jgi:hypothetical protein
MGLFKEASGGKFGNVPTLFSEGSADFYGITHASTPNDVGKNWASYRTYKYINTLTAAGLKTATNEQMYSYLIDAMRDSKLIAGPLVFHRRICHSSISCCKGP